MLPPMAEPPMADLPDEAPPILVRSPAQAVGSRKTVTKNENIRNLIDPAPPPFFGLLVNI
jgi:hypothetical protein